MTSKATSGSEADKFCNPLVEVEQCAEGLKKWAEEKQKPKNKADYIGNTYCNNLCHRYKSKKPNHGRNPYDTHVTCKRCDGIWMKREDCIQGKRIRCPCCNIQVRTTARRKYSGETAKIYQGQSP
jgi:hypothetical protein